MNDIVANIVGSLEYVLPETVLLGTVCVFFLAGPFLVSETGVASSGLRHRWGVLSLIAVACAALLWWQQDLAPESTAPFRLDSLAWFTRGLSLASAAVLLLASWNQIEDARTAEHHACLLAISAGVTLVAAANDLVVLFLALELVSIPTYVLLALPRRDAQAQEAVVKYFLLSVFSSAIFLYGLSFLYGVAGSTNLVAVQKALTEGSGSAMPVVLTMAVVAMVAGLSFRMTAVPFHFYAPDVFQGAPTSGAAMLAFVPKIAGFVALLRLVAFPAAADGWTLAGTAQPVLWVIAVASMFGGNLLALLQTNVKRLLAWSSVAHAGYMLVGVIAGERAGAAVTGLDALLFYLVAYGAMTVGAFAILAALARKGRKYETLDDLAGLSQTNPAMALVMAVFLFSLTGLPPTAGFVGKLNLFLAAWSAGTDASRLLAILLAVNAAIGAWYYLRVVAAMYLQRPRNAEAVSAEVPATVAAAVCLVATIGLFVLPDVLWQLVRR